jgi:hypothetical protein
MDPGEKAATWRLIKELNIGCTCVADLPVTFDFTCKWFHFSFNAV